MPTLTEATATHPALSRIIDEISTACNVDAEKLPKAVEQILCNLGKSDEILRPEQRLGSASSYTRHLLHADPLHRFSIVAIVWHTGQITPVHAHYTWCVYRVIAGCLQEEHYRWDADNGCASYTDTINREVGASCSGHAGYEQIHRLGNVGNEPAISIHVYGIDGARISTHINRIPPVVHAKTGS